MPRSLSRRVRKMKQWRPKGEPWDAVYARTEDVPKLLASRWRAVIQTGEQPPVDVTTPVGRLYARWDAQRARMPFGTESAVIQAHWKHYTAAEMDWWYMAREAVRPELEEARRTGRCPTQIGLRARPENALRTGGA